MNADAEAALLPCCNTVKAEVLPPIPLGDNRTWKRHNATANWLSFRCVTSVSFVTMVPLKTRHFEQTLSTVTN